jgi:hypothetical protein
MTPRERQIVKAWADQAFGGAVESSSIVWSYQDHPVKPRPYLTLRELGDQRVTGVPEKRHVDVSGTMTQRTRESWECSVGLQVSTMLDERTPAHSQSASAILAAALRHLYSEAVGIPYLTDAQCGVVSVDGPVDLTALAGGSQWETRAEVTIVFALVRIYDEAIPNLEQVAGAGSLSLDDETIAVAFDTEA